MANKPNPANFTPEIPDFPNVPNFLPCYGRFDLTTYIKGASDYEIMCNLVQLYNTMAEGYNKVEKLSTDTQKAYVQLQNFVNTWFDGLDVTDEVSTILHRMVDDGSLEQVVAQTGQVAPATKEFLSSSEGIEQITPPINDSVRKWLDGHPEATTTVQDKSLTKEKFTDKLVLETVKDYVTPEMFGAVGDGEHDDTEAVQRMFDFAFNSNIKRVFINKPVKIKSIDITNKYYRGLIISSHSATNQEHNSMITVYGSDSIGFDTSGTEGLVFRDICIRGDDVEPPKCLIYASRTTANRKCDKYIFENCYFLGCCSEALIYNYAGEQWSIYNSTFTVYDRADAYCCLYFTSVNKRGLLSKFANADDYVTPLTNTKFINSTFISKNGNPSVIFESENLSGHLDITISNILFEGCYSINELNSSFVFDNVSDTITFLSCDDESGATDKSERTQPIIHCKGTNVLSGLALIGCVLYGKTNTPFLKTECPLYSYNNISCRTQNDGIWVFTNQSEFLNHNMLRDQEKFIANRGKYVSVGCTNVQHTNIDVKNSNTYPQMMEHEYIEMDESPSGLISAAMGAIVYDTTNKIFYIGNGYTPWAWNVLSVKS